MNLKTLLQERGIDFERSTHRATYTSQGLAAEEHISGYYVAKPVVVRCDIGFAMCVIPACARLDLDLVADVLQSLDVRLATESEMASLFPDCELGAEPPVGVMFGLKTVVDSRLHADDYVVMQAGTHTEAVKVNRNDWEQLCDPIVADITHR